MTESAAPPPEVLRADYFQHPLDYFTRMREEGPVVPVVPPGGGPPWWMVTRYEDVRAALANPRLHKDWLGKLASPDFVPDEVTSYLSVHLLNADPPAHTRLRKLVTRAFTARRVAGLRPRVEAITAALLDAVEVRLKAGEDTIDLIEAFAFPLPVTVICELLGVPVRDQAQFREWSDVIVASEPEPGAVHTAGIAMFRYFTDLVAAKRAGPADDLVSALVEASESSESGESLSQNELIAMLFLLMVAGHETTTNLIASGVLALLANPAELARLRSDPALLPGAVEELLRYANPLNHATERFTLEPLEIGGVTIPARSWVICVTSSANRDPAHFADAGQLDVGRDAGGHVAFGHGIHYCLGAPLARLEGEVAFGALLARFPSIALAADPATLRWRPSSLIHGLESLPVRPTRDRGFGAPRLLLLSSQIAR